MSSRDMTINQIKAVNKEFGAKHTIKVNGFNEPKDKIPPWFKSFIQNQFTPFVKQQIKFNNQMLEFKDYVLEQFKKHGWVK